MQKKLNLIFGNYIKEHQSSQDFSTAPNGETREFACDNSLGNCSFMALV